MPILQNAHSHVQNTRPVPVKREHCPMTKRNVTGDEYKAETIDSGSE